jgi:tRNA G18 (ribose-2'-O)-methylase SpoU
MPEIVVIAHNIRSTHNIGSLFRTAEGFGVTHLYISGYTPYPMMMDDARLPHISGKLTAQIHKTALGAESLVPFSVSELPPLKELSSQGYRLVALEQSLHSQTLESYSPPEKVALLIGEEVSGIETQLLAECDDVIEIGMVGLKESFNVSVATGIALFALTTSK